MPRADLLALDTETLVVLANRGLVRRAQAEIESGQLESQIEEIDDGTVTIQWSDGVTCVVPTGKALGDGRCTCPATTLCRHLLRSVLAYQRVFTAENAESAERDKKGQTDRADGNPQSEHSTANTQLATPPPHHLTTSPPHHATPWDPGALSDEEVARSFKAADLPRARRIFDEGQVVELVRSMKPSAHFHSLSCTVRFMVPHDLRYTHCDCADPSPCLHAMTAVWAFRLLAPEQAGGVVTTHASTEAVPTALLDDAEQCLRDLSLFGIAGAPQTFADRLRRLEARCREESLVWPAEILAELEEQRRSYAARDARFFPRRVAELAGELLVRCDALRAATGAVPPLFIRGDRSDRVTEVGSARLIGLGCGVTVHRGGAELIAYLQDSSSGSVVAIGREFPDPAPDENAPPREFWQLAQWTAVRGTPLAALGGGQLLIRGGKRTPSCRFLPGRAQAAFNPQSFQWESLRPPVLVEDFGELAARLDSLPPECLRPRRVAANLHVCAVAGVEHAAFSEIDQTVLATLRDAQGDRALMVHPYTSRGREGAEALMARLRAEPEALRFIAAQVRRGPGGLVLAPVGLVFESGGRRTLLQPWIDRLSQTPTSRHADTTPPPHHHTTPPPHTDYLNDLFETLGEQWLLGLQRADFRIAAWRARADRGAGLGFHRLLRPVRRLADSLEARAATLHWDPAPIIPALLTLTALVRLAQDEATTEAPDCGVAAPT